MAELANAAEPTGSSDVASGKLASLGRLARRYPGLTALVLGVIAALGFPPLGLWPFTLLAMGALSALVLTAASKRAAFWRGWMFGVGHFTLANNWIATAFTYQEEMPAMLGWVAVPLLSLYLAIYPALGTLAAWWIGRKFAPRWFAATFAACWIVSEWLRSWVFTGYAWDPLGLVFLGTFEAQGLAALLPWLGTYALSGLVVLIAAGLWFAFIARRWLPLAVTSLALFAGMYLPFVGNTAEGTVRYTLIQPDVRQNELDDAAKFEEQFVRISNLTAPVDGDDRDAGKRLVLWPESGVPDYLEDGYPQRYYDRMTAAGDPAYARWRIGQVIGEDAVLMTGAVNLDIEGEGNLGRAVSARNSVVALNGQGEFVAKYAKAHLVPYGEYLALRWLLEPLGATRLVKGTIDFHPGPGPQTLDLGDFGKAGAQICYEIVFSGQVADRDNRPDYIFNPSNDGWFGAFGPPQHLAQARLRAIEEGLPVLRSTTTGISAVVDANGIVRQHIGMHKAARLDGLIPPANPPTVFSRLGNALPLGWALLLLLASLLASRLQERRLAAKPRSNT